MSDKADSNVKNFEEHSTAKYLIFELAGEEYGIPLSAVREVIEVPPITTLPHTPKFFRGLINLRENVISVFDLRIQLGLPEIKIEAKKTSTIITEIQRLPLGIIVDEVKEVRSIKSSKVEVGFEDQTRVGRQFIKGIAKEGENLIVILEVEQLLSSQQIDTLRQQAA